MYPGDPDGYFPSIYADDAASAVVAALSVPTRLPTTSSTTSR